MSMLKFLFSAPQTTWEWILFLTACVLAVAFIVWAVVATIKLIKNGKLNELKNAIVDAIKEAEKTHGGPDEKLEYALTLIRKYCENIGVKINDALLEWIVSYIKKYILDHNELEEIEEQEGKKK